MRSLYWILALGVVAALFAAAWFARQLSQDDAVPTELATVEEVAVEPLAPQEEVFETPEIDRKFPPSFDIVRISRNGTGVVAGRGEAGKTVDLLVNGTAVANAMADVNREWVIILSAPLPPGSIELSLRSIGADGSPIVSENVVIVEIPADGQDGVLAVLSPRGGEGPSRALQVPGAAAGAALKLHIASIDVLPDGIALASGSASPGDVLRVYVNNAYINETVADEDGNWRLPLGALQDETEHELRVDQIVRDEGSVALRLVQPFSKSKAFDPTAGKRSVIVTRGNNLWAIARSVYGGGELFSLIFEQNSAQIRNPDLIYPGQVFDLPLDMPQQQ